MSILRKSLFLLVPSLLLAASVKSSELAKPGEKPNVIVIYVDDVGWVDLESYGSEFYETPNIDSLLSQGLRFTQAYSNAPLCSPSRIGLLTGRHCARAKCYEVVSGKWDETGFFLRYGPGTKDDIIWDWEERVDFDPPHNNLDLPRDRKIMPEYFKELGYFTGFFGKWHVGPQNPNDRGFDDYASLQLFVNGAHLDVTKGRTVKTPDYPEPSGTSGDYMTRLGLEFVDRAGDRPFFLYLAHPLIHTPFDVPPDLLEKYEKKSPTLIQSDAVYAGMMEMLDDSIGGFIDGLEERGQMDDTLIIFTSDNGGMTGPTKASPELNGYMLGEITNMYPLRGGKVQLWEGGIRVPMGIVFGDRIPGKTFTGVTTQLDILPTILEVVGYPDFENARASLDGRSLKPILEDPNSNWEERSIFFHHPGYRGMTFKPAFEGQGAGFDQRPESIIRRGDWKLIESLETGKVQLYNLHVDIGETTDVSADHPELVASLKNELRAWWMEVDADMPISKIAGP